MLSRTEVTAPGGLWPGGAAKHTGDSSLMGKRERGVRCSRRAEVRAALRHYSLVEKRGAAVAVEGSGPGGVYEKFLKASRSKAVSRRRCSSVRWVFLLPVAGAAAGSRPAYHTGLARLMVVRSLGFT